MRELSESFKRKKTDLTLLSDEKLNDLIAEFADDILAKLADAYFEAVDRNGWTQRDVAAILNWKESQVSHILSGRRKNLTASSIASLARALQKRPELNLVDVRPKGNFCDRNRDDEPSSMTSLIGKTVSVPREASTAAKFKADAKDTLNFADAAL